MKEKLSYKKWIKWIYDFLKMFKKRFKQKMALGI
jgi:hypothetical protein